MIPKTLLSIVACLLFAGCVSSVPFSEAERGKSFSLNSFENALIDEKTHYLENEIKNLRQLEPTDPNVVKLRTFVLKEFPTLSEWNKMKAKAKPGDAIVEYHHRLYLKSYDGPADSDKRGFALVRNGQIIDFVFVAGAYSSDY